MNVFISFFKTFYLKWKFIFLFLNCTNGCQNIMIKVHFWLFFQVQLPFSHEWKNIPLNEASTFCLPFLAWKNCLQNVLEKNGRKSERWNFIMTKCDDLEKPFESLFKTSKNINKILHIIFLKFVLPISVQTLYYFDVKI